MTKYEPNTEALRLLFSSGLERYFSIMDICDSFKLAKQLLASNREKPSSLYETFACALFDQYDLDHSVSTFYNLEVRAICFTAKQIFDYYDSSLEESSDWDLFDQLQEDVTILYGQIVPYDDPILINQCKMLLAKVAEPCVFLHKPCDDIQQHNHATLAHALLNK